MYLEDVFELILENDDKLLRYYRNNILSNFKKNSKSELILSERQYCIMYLIIHRNINKVTDIAHYLDLSKANISILVSKLVDNNFIVRQKSENSDSRVTILVATDEGRDAFKQIRESLVENIATLVDEDECADNVIFDLANKLQQILKVDRKPDNIHDFVIFVAIRTNRFFENMYNKIIVQSKFDLSVSEMRIIKTLDKSGRTNFETLANTMAISHSTLSLQVKQLQDNGYIIKEKSDIDGRVMYLTLTEKGVDVNNRLLEYKRQIIYNRFDNKTQNEMRFIYQTLFDLFNLFDSVDNINVKSQYKEYIEYIDN